MCSGVGYAKMDYPTQQAIYHCRRGERGKERVWKEERKKGDRGRLSEKESEGFRREMIGWRAWGKIDKK